MIRDMCLFLNLELPLAMNLANNLLDSSAIMFFELHHIIPLGWEISFLFIPSYGIP
jgi:hypothetical protein